MGIHVLNSKWLPLALVSLSVVSGCCCQAYPLPGENQCPTDARRLYLACGEEAVRRCPCGPDREYYGLKPTCWRQWPEGWRCGQTGCASCRNGASCAEPVCEESIAAQIDPNPFRSDTYSNRPQQTPATLPLLEKVPANKPAPVSGPAEIPAAKNPTTVSPPIQVPAVNTVPPQAGPVPVPPPRVTPLEIKPSQTTPLAIPPAQSPPPPVQQPPAKPSATNTPAETHRIANTDAKEDHTKTEPAKPLIANEPAAKRESTDKTLSNRVEQHLFNNLEM